MANQSGQAKKQRRYTPRQTRKFQLRLDEPADVHVREILDYARSKRKEVTMIREGVALWWALENGNLDYLFEKFPQYRQQLQPKNDDLIEQFRQMLQQQSAESGKTPQISGEPAASGPKPLATRHISLPAFDDDDDMATVTLKPMASSSDAGMNLLQALLGKQ